MTARLFARDDDFCGGRGLGPRENPVVFNHEVVAQWYKKQDSDGTAQKAHHHNLQQRWRDNAAPWDSGQHVQSRYGENSAGDHMAAVRSNTLNYHVFKYGAFPFEKLA